MAFFNKEKKMKRILARYKYRGLLDYEDIEWNTRQGMFAKEERVFSVQVARQLFSGIKA